MFVVLDTRPASFGCIGGVRIPLGDPDVGVAQDLLDHTHVHTLLHEQGTGGMPAVVHSRVAYPATARSSFQSDHAEAWT
jgi:hypothetical protein